MRKAKILATLGPACSGPGILEELINAGMNGVRLNFSHGDHDSHRKLFEKVRSISKRKKVPLSVMADLQGPKIRVGKLEEPVLLKKGKIVSISSEVSTGCGDTISCTYKGLAKDVRKGDSILVDDGLIELQVVSKRNKAIQCRVITGGILKEHKGMNFPGVPISVSSITSKDVRDLKFALSLGVDYVAVSFVRSRDDILRVKKIIRQAGKNIPVIAKIEKPEALSNIDGILEESAGLMVARGDLAVETSIEGVPVIQKRLIKQCNLEGKISIVATQMLDSMAKNTTPTRAEASDVANAVFDGADILMLSQETAIGNYPLKSVQTMDRIISEAEGSSYFQKHQYIPDDENLSILNGITHAACLGADETKAGALVVYSLHGNSVLMISKKRPRVNIVAFTPEESLFNRYSLFYGIRPFLCTRFRGVERTIKGMTALLKKNSILKSNEVVVFLVSDHDNRHIVKIDTVR